MFLMCRELNAKEADQILQKPVMNIETVKMALNAKSALVRNKFVRSHSLRETMATYPYLKDTELVSLVHNKGGYY